MIWKEQHLLFKCSFKAPTCRSRYQPFLTGMHVQLWHAPGVRLSVFNKWHDPTDEPTQNLFSVFVVKRLITTICSYRRPCSLMELWNLCAYSLFFQTFQIKYKPFSTYIFFTPATRVKDRDVWSRCVYLGKSDNPIKGLDVFWRSSLVNNCNLSHQELTAVINKSKHKVLPKPNSLHSIKWVILFSFFLFHLSYNCCTLPSELSVAYDLWAGLLCRRDDAYGGTPLWHGSLRSGI